MWCSLKQFGNCFFHLSAYFASTRPCCKRYCTCITTCLLSIFPLSFHFVRFISSVEMFTGATLLPLGFVSSTHSITGTKHWWTPFKIFSEQRLVTFLFPITRLWTGAQLSDNDTCCGDINAGSKGRLLHDILAGVNKRRRAITERAEQGMTTSTIPSTPSKPPPHQAG